MVRFCLRNRVASAFSQFESCSVNPSSLLGRSGTLNFGSTSPARMYLRIVFRDRPVRREINLIVRNLPLDPQSSGGDSLQNLFRFKVRRVP